MQASEETRKGKEATQELVDTVFDQIRRGRVFTGDKAAKSAGGVSPCRDFATRSNAEEDGDNERERKREGTDDNDVLARSAHA
jgi:hypothetical protein